MRVGQFDESHTEIDLIELKGIGKETIRKNIPINKLSDKNVILTGKQLPDDKYEQMRQLCHSITVKPQSRVI